MVATTQLSRRRLLQAGSLAAGGLALGLQPAKALAKPAIHSGKLNLPALAKGFQGRLLFPDDADFAAAAWPNASRWANVTPRAIALCASDSDVASCIGWAREAGMPVAIRSGGHSYAGFSTTEGLLIDVKYMKDIAYGDGTVTVQAGVNNDDLAGALRATGHAVPSGRCPTVGTSGLVLGGGWGFSATHGGLTCDSLLDTDIVLADGTVRHTIASSEPLLFWGIRGGGGGNFGVNTSFTFKLHDVGDVTVFNIVWPPGKQIDLMLMLQKIQLEQATTLSTRSKVTQTKAGVPITLGQLAVQTLGLFWGNPADLRAIMAPAFELLQPVVAEINGMTYWSARDYLVTDDPIGFYDIRASYVRNGLTDKALSTMLEFMQAWPGGSVVQQNMGILFAIGGEVKSKAPDAMAYVHRDANFIFEMETSWSPMDKPDVVERQQAWLKDYHAAMLPFTTGGSYVNFPSRDLPNWAQAYYGSNLPKLSQIKKRYDADNFFRFAQSIPPA